MASACAEVYVDGARDQSPSRPAAGVNTLGNALQATHPELMCMLCCCRADEEAEFKEFATQPQLLDIIAKQIAPRIFGHEDIKQAVACLLFGGARKVRLLTRLLGSIGQPRLQASCCKSMHVMSPNDSRSA